MKLTAAVIAAAISLTASLALTGCDRGLPKTIDIDRYYVFQPKGLKQVVRHGEQYFISENKDHEAVFAIFGYKELLALGLEIRNKTGKDIEPEQYSLKLYDGRDLLPIKLITKEDLYQIEKKLMDPKGFSLSSPSIQGAVSAVDSLISLPSSSYLGSNLQNIIENYFEFRPVYANSSRKGFLAFYHGFKLEYPLALELNIKGESKMYYFAPVPKTPSK